MANTTFTATANLAITGLTPTIGPKATVSATQTFTSSATAAGDYISETFTVNASTTATAINMGKITLGRCLMLECSGPLLVTLTQDLGSGAEDVVMLVSKFLLIQTSFTGLKVANTGSTAVTMSVTLSGDRPDVGTTPGVY